MRESPSQTLPAAPPRSSALGSALGVLHILACAVAAVWLMRKVGPAAGSLIQPVKLGPGWYLFWCAGFAAIALGVRQPLIALLAFVAMSEGTPRYFPAYQVMMKIGLLNWAAALAVSAWLCRRRPLPIYRLAWVMVGFIVWLIVCAAVAALRGSPWDPHPNHHPERFAHALAVFFLAGQLLRGAREAWWFCAVFIATLLARWAVSGSAIGPSPTYSGGDGDISALAVIAMPFALLGAQLSRPLWGKVAFLIALVGLIVLLGVTRNRNGAIAFVVLLPSLWLLARHRGRILLAATPALVIVAILFFYSPYWKRFTDIFTGGDDANSANTRLLIWQSAGRMIRANPVFGVGTGNFHNVVGRYTPAQQDLRQIGPSPLRSSLDEDRYAAHNSLIHVTGDAGIPGGILYLTLFAGALVHTFRLARRGGTDWPAPAARTLFAGLCVYLAIGLFISRHDMAMGYLLAGWAGGLMLPSDKKST